MPDRPVPATGDVLWEINLGSSVSDFPIIYAVAKLCALPYSYWQTALNTMYEKSVTEAAPGRRTYRLTVSVVEREADPEHILITLTLRPRFGVSRLRRRLAISPSGLVRLPRARVAAAPVAPPAVADPR